MKKKKILVTGGAGFIGSHVVDLYIKKGHKVIVVDNLSSGIRQHVNKKAKFYKVNITDKKKMRDIFKKEKPDVINHHAAHIHVRTSVENPVYDARQNILGSLHLLDLAREFNVEKFIYASSGGAEYGNPVKIPCSESHPINPVSPYGISKHTVEHYLFAYRELYGLDYIVLCYANVYGPRQDPKGEAGIVAIFSGKFLSGKVPTIFGTGRNTRDYVYVKDVAQANWLALKKNTKKFKKRRFNIGRGKEVSTNKIAAEIRRAVGTRIKPIHGAPVSGEVKRIALKNSRAKRMLGWKPKYSLGKGIRETVRFFRD